MAKYTPDMFTGIIKELGKVKKITKSSQSATFVIQAKSILKNKKIGESIAVNGVCVTITKLTKGNFEFEAIKETLDISNLKSLKTGSKVNLEPALTLNQSLDGHLVQGHIDTEGTVENYNENPLTIKFPKQISES
ncbi:MAG: riboflavin synthase, partial [Patescibacteria group bacterium]